MPSLYLALFPTCLFGRGVFFSAAKREEMEVTRAAFGRAHDWTLGLLYEATSFHLLPERV